MTTNVRLSNKERELIREKCVEINKILIKNNKEPLKDSEMVHAILELAIKHVEVKPSGEIYIDK